MITHIACVINVWMEYFSLELKVGRLKWIILWKTDRQFKLSSLIRSAFWSCHYCIPSNIYILNLYNNLQLGSGIIFTQESGLSIVKSLSSLFNLFYINCDDLILNRKYIFYNKNRKFVIIL